MTNFVLPCRLIREREEWEERLSSEEQRHREAVATLTARHHDVVNRLNRLGIVLMKTG